eukprot:COSAG02_NODE_802_length_17030_cov_37.485500_19_plen_64_part_00
MLSIRSEAHVPDRRHECPLALPRARHGEHAWRLRAAGRRAVPRRPACMRARARAVRMQILFHF